MPQTTRFDTSNSRRETSQRSLVRLWVELVLLSLAVALGVGAYKLVANSPSLPAGAPLAVPQKAVPNLVRDGSRIVVPEGSPLRGKLTIDTVALQQVERTLQLPAMVESEPATPLRCAPARIRP